MDALIDFEIAFTLFIQNLGNWLEMPMQAFTFLGSELFFLLIMPALYWSIDPVIGFTEYDDYWAVENSYSTYLVPRSAGATYKIEPISDGEAA